MAKNEMPALHSRAPGEPTFDEPAHEHVQGGGALTISERAKAPVPTFNVGGFEYELEKQVTRPVLSQEDAKPIFILFDGKIHKAEERRGEKERKESDPPPPMIADITNLETGQLQTLVCGAVLVGELEEKYPQDSYVGKAFRLESVLIPIKGQSGKKMRIYNIQELRRK